MTMLTVNKIRVSVNGGKVYRCDGDYSKKATDVRYVVIPTSEYDITAVGRNGASPSELAREHNAEIAINFPYYNGADGALIGGNIVAGNPKSYEVAKTAKRHEFYAKDGAYFVGDAKGIAVDFAVQGSPVLLRNSEIVVHPSLYNDQLSRDVWERAQRTAVGIRANGDVVFLVSDGRIPSDIGLFLSELALVMRDELGCIHAINGDGGGSSVLYANGKIVNQRSNADNERRSGCALIVRKKEVFKVVIDAGHGPNTPGKRTPDGTMREYEFNSVVARYVREMLSHYRGVSTLFTHEDARDVPLKERTDKANAWKADILVSIHANASGNAWSDAKGIETCVYTTKPLDSIKLANHIQDALISETKRPNRGVKAADFHVLRETRMAAVLVECGFMTSHEESTLLKTDTYRRQCAKAIVDGIAKCYGLTHDCK
jgi:N-acetylmuramoyl-L-alanine amidase